MFCYIDKNSSIQIICPIKDYTGLKMYIKYKKVRCTVNCYFESEKAHIVHKNGAYKPEHFEKIKEIIAYKFDFVLENLEM